MITEKMNSLFFMFICTVAADLDQWQATYRTNKVTKIAVNSRALYYIDTNRHLYILEKDTGPVYLLDMVFDVDVNENNGLWVIYNPDNIYFRNGITSSNIEGVGWEQAAGAMQTITTGRQGIVTGHAADGNMYLRMGVSSSAAVGTSWQQLPGGNAKAESCGLRVCFYVNTANQLYATGLLPNTNAPMMAGDWTFTTPNVKDISAYGEKTLWKIDTSGASWEAVDVMDADMFKIHWVRRGYQATRFKEIAVTDKKAYAVTDDGHVMVRTGCPIFDFEDDDISGWQQTGTAFADQPVISHLWTSYAKVMGKVGERTIDTLSKRKSSSQPADDSTLATEGPQGTLTSPPFQIRSAFLHFSIGGGSHPNNFVALIIDGQEIRTSSGGSGHKGNSHGGSIMARFWWDVSSQINKCAKIKIYDLSSESWGHTQFDDLRASPPCFKGMKTTWMHHDVINVGRQVKEMIKLEGFSTSKLRRLIISVSLPVFQGSPLAYIKKVHVKRTHCQSKIIMTKDLIPNTSKNPHKVTATINNLLSDAELEVVVRAYDHGALQASGNTLSGLMKITVNFADEYLKRMTRMVAVKRHGNETARLLAKSYIMNPRNYTAGENLTIEVELRHKVWSMQRAFNIHVKINVPPYLTWLATRGLNASLDETGFATTSSEHVAIIPELLLDHNKTIAFDVRINDDSSWRRKSKKMLLGDVVLDATYCPRINCRNKDNSDVEVAWLEKNKNFKFNFFHAEERESASRPFSAIVDKTGSFVFVCATLPSHLKRSTANCYFKNMTSKAWRGLGLAMTNVSFYDSKKKELYGLHDRGYFMKQFGERFEESEMLPVDEWNSVVAASASFDTAVNGMASSRNSSRDRNIVAANTHKISISSDGVSSLLAEATAWQSEIKWRCCD